MAGFVEQSEDLPDTLEGLLGLHERCVLGKVHTCMIGRVTAFNDAKQTCSVRPVARGRFVNGDTVQEPIIPNVPVVYPQAGGFFLYMPLKPGDDVVVSICERSIEEWKAQSLGDYAPRSTRRMDFSDAVVYPGVSSPNNPLNHAQGDCLVMGEDSPTGARLEIGDGKVSLGTPVLELVDLLEQLATATAAITVSSAPIDNAAVISAIAALIGQLKK